VNYIRIYNSLIDNARSRLFIEGYCEAHHITPKSMSGSDDDSNLVNLTAREHFIAHYLLAKAYGGDQWRPLLYWKERNSRLYDLARLKVSELMKFKEPWNKNLTGGIWSEARRKAQKNVVHKGLSEETRAKMRKPKSPQHSAKIKLAKQNQSAETRNKNSESQKRRFQFGLQAVELNRLIDSIFTQGELR